MKGAEGILPPAVLVVLGAIPGAWLRYTLVRLGATKLRQRHWATWGVNMVACVLIGLLAGQLQRWDRTSQDSLELTFAVGFLGSLSTYSTLVAELVSLWQDQGKRHALRLATASLLGGLLACSLGLLLARGGQ